MTNFFTLKLLDRFKGLFRLIGVDYQIMRMILAVKLTMDQRRVPTIFQDAKQKKGNTFLKSLLLYAFYGLILIPFIIMNDNYLFQMSIVFSIVMFILMTSMISDFSTVLLDVRDKTILHTKPIDSRTINATKFVHVVIYMSQVTGAFVLIPLLVALGTKGIGFAMVFIAGIILNVLFIIVLTALFYIFILRFFDGERLKDFINYVQIFLSVAILVGYQIVIRSFEFIDLSVQFEWQWWQILLPPFWFAAPFELFLNGDQGSPYILLLSIMALVIPILSMMLYLYLIPSFERNLQKLLETSGSQKAKGLKWDKFLARISCTTQEERALFQFSSKMLKQEREFKLKVYPSLGFSIVIPFIFLFNVLRTDMSSPNVYLTIYFCNLMIPNIIHMLKFSGNYKGAWIYRTLPISKPKEIYRATLKAFLLKLYMPVILTISLIFVVIFSTALIPDIIAIILGGWVYALICYRFVNNQRFPFSQSFRFAQNADTGNTILLMFVIGGFALVHALFQLIPFGVYMYIVVLAIVNWFAWKRVFN